MPFFVYILQSHKDGSFYVGYTQQQLAERIVKILKLSDAGII